MRSAFAHDSYTPLEIAQAAQVAEADVLDALGYARDLVPHAEAVRIGRMLVQRPATRRAAAEGTAAEGAARRPQSKLESGSRAPRAETTASSSFAA